jgi:Cu(I)/Ag(I) efflux system periplasmic protein CusF
MKRNLVIALLIALAAPVPLFADAHQASSPAATQGSGQLAEGDVRKVDKETKKITIRHGPIQNLDMPAMTMVFQVKDAAMLDKVKAGDKIKFAADKEGGTFTVNQLEVVK